MYGRGTEDEHLLQPYIPAELFRGSDEERKGGV
jgi:hypothetical protein